MAQTRMTQPHPVTSELLACPHCGGEARWQSNEERWTQIVCNSCGCKSPEIPGKQYSAQAAAAWNRRTPPAACPSGWQLVPLEPNEEMAKAWMRGVPDASFRVMYRALLAAAPPPPASAEGKGEWMGIESVMVKFVLDNASLFKWSLQGMGMLRLHLPNDVRIHIWDSRFRVPNVSMIHDHLQWGLESTIVSGKLINRRYFIDGGNIRTGFGCAKGYSYLVIKPGFGCYHKTEPKLVLLTELEPDTYTAGMTYRQKPDEIHQTDAEDGTVTVMRKFPTNDESARVFWPRGDEWVNAEPRAATDTEVTEIVRLALQKWQPLPPPPEK